MYIDSRYFGTMFIRSRISQLQAIYRKPNCWCCSLFFPLDPIIIRFILSFAFVLRVQRLGSPVSSHTSKCVFIKSRSEALEIVYINILDLTRSLYQLFFTQAYSLDFATFVDFHFLQLNALNRHRKTVSLSESYAWNFANLP